MMSEKIGIAEILNILKYLESGKNKDGTEYPFLPEVYLERMRISKGVGYLKSPLTIGWVITGKCNSRCIHCWSKKSAEEVEYPLALSLVNQFKELEVSRVIISGGEPLLHPHLLDILREIKRANINISLYTNGSLLTHSIINKFQTLFTKFDVVQISLDGPDREVYFLQRQQDFFNDVVHSIKYIASSSFIVRIHFVATPINVEKIFETFKFVNNLGANSFVVSKVYPLLNGMKLAKMLDENKYLHEIIKCIKFRIDNKTETSFKAYLPFKFIQYLNEYYNILYKIFPQFFNSLGNLWINPPEGNSFLLISPEGNVYPGTTLEEDKYFAGNVKDTPLYKIWEEGKNWDALRNKFSLTNVKCGKCKLYPLCEGYDIYSSIYKFGKSYCEVNNLRLGDENEINQ